MKHAQTYLEDRYNCKNDACYLQPRHIRQSLMRKVEVVSSECLSALEIVVILREFDASMGPQNKEKFWRREYNVRSRGLSIETH